MSAPPLPDTAWLPTREFFAAAARGELAIPRCADCGAFNWYPPPACTVCGSEALPWTRVSGRGRLFAWTVVRRALYKPFAEQVPYVPALVALEEDPAVRLVTDLVECAPEALRPGLPLRAVFRPLRFAGSERTVVVPLFAPLPSAASAPAGGPQEKL